MNRLMEKRSGAGAIGAVAGPAVGHITGGIARFLRDMGISVAVGTAGGLGAAHLIKKRREQAANKKTAPKKKSKGGEKMQEKTAFHLGMEKAAFYGDIGETYKVREGDHKGKRGVLVSWTRKENRKCYLDSDGSEVTRESSDRSADLKFEDGTVVTFNKPDTQLRRVYEHDDDCAIKSCG